MLISFEENSVEKRERTGFNGKLISNSFANVEG
jgi:hypothetical protein